MISNDVNVIFSFLDKKHIFHSKARLFVYKNKRGKYVMLNKVTNHFIDTYKNYVLNVGRIIVNQVALFKESRTKSPVKDLSNDFIVKMIETDINKELSKSLIEFPNVSIETFLDFKDLLLGYFSIPELYYKEKAIGEFREKFIEKAKNFAIDSINRFGNNFKNIRTMKLRNYTKYEEHLKNINMKDYEDRQICAELFSFGEEHGSLKFLTFDKNFKNYLKKHGEKYKVKVIAS